MPLLRRELDFAYSLAFRYISFTHIDRETNDKCPQCQILVPVLYYVCRVYIYMCFEWKNFPFLEVMYV